MPKISPDPEARKKVSQIKEKFDFENGHLNTSLQSDENILSKCSNYQAPAQARDLGIYPYFREIEETGNSHVVIDGVACRDSADSGVFCQTGGVASRD